jgi:hypothetical protein
MHIRDILVKTLGLLSPLSKRIETLYDLADTSGFDENARTRRLFPRLSQEYGVTIAYVLFLIFPSEIKRMEQIEYSILPTKDAGAVMALKESISSDCGMFAVAVRLAFLCVLSSQLIHQIVCYHDPSCYHSVLALQLEYDALERPWSLCYQFGHWSFIGILRLSSLDHNEPDAPPIRRFAMAQ